MSDLKQLRFASSSGPPNDKNVLVLEELAFLDSCSTAERDETNACVLQIGLAQQLQYCRASFPLTLGGSQ
jgi:hypothetical protein